MPNTHTLSNTVQDVHGAGAQRSEVKFGAVPSPGYRGPQNDYLRIDNMVRCVRGTSSKSPSAPATCSTSSKKKPNFIIMQPDDLEFFEAWTPPAHFGDEKKYTVDYPEFSDLKNMNFLRENGVQMKQAYAASPVCGTSRYSTITGRFPSRSSNGRAQESGETIRNVQIPNTKLHDRRTAEDGKDCSDNNLAAVFRNNNYNTGVVGKWHLSKIPNTTLDYPALQTTIQQCGFNYTEGLYPENLEGGWQIDEQHNMEYITSKAIDFIERSVASSDPFFLYFNPTAPHSSGSVHDALTKYSCTDTPEGPLPEEPKIPFGMTENGKYTCAEYRQTVIDRANGSTDNNLLGSIWVDDSIGSILDTLRHHGELDNTFILFQQDHGAEGKGSLYETGLRIAQFVHFPDEIKAGSTFNGMVSTVDIAPTVLDYAGIDLQTAYNMDGKSWKQELDFEQDDWADDRCLFFELDRDRAVRCGCYKYIQVFDDAAAMSSTEAVADKLSFPLSLENVYDLCTIDEEYIVSPAGFPEYDGSVSTSEVPLRDEMKAVADCFMGMTDPSKTPVYDADSCSTAIVASLGVRTASPTDTPNTCNSCSRGSVANGYNMIFVDPQTGACNDGCYDVSSLENRKKNGWECGVCDTPPPTPSPTVATCGDVCYQGGDLGRPGVTMKIDAADGTCSTGCFDASVQQRKMNNGWECGECAPSKGGALVGVELDFTGSLASFSATQIGSLETEICGALENDSVASVHTTAIACSYESQSTGIQSVTANFQVGYYYDCSDPMNCSFLQTGGGVQLAQNLFNSELASVEAILLNKRLFRLVNSITLGSVKDEGASLCPLNPTRNQCLTAGCNWNGTAGVCVDL